MNIRLIKCTCYSSAFIEVNVLDFFFTFVFKVEKRDKYSNYDGRDVGFIWPRSQKGISMLPCNDSPSVEKLISFSIRMIRKIP